MRSVRARLTLGCALLALGASSAYAPSSAAAETPAGTPAPSEPAAAPGEPAPAAPASPGSPQQPTGSAAPVPSSTRLSNAATASWAHPEGTGPIYRRPHAGSARIARVHLYTADGFPEVYPLLVGLVDPEGREWYEVRIPGRPNGRVGWVQRELLGPVHRTHWRIVVNRGRRRMRVYYTGHLLRVFPVGVGKPSTPTPAGHFWIDERFKLSNPANPYWPYALGTSDYSTLRDWPGEGVIGIHGPYGEPQRIPGDPSHGCIRMLTPDIAWLGPRVTLGTPVRVI